MDLKEHKRNLYKTVVWLLFLPRSFSQTDILSSTVHYYVQRVLFMAAAVVCSGCSKRYRRLDGARCDACNDKASGQVTSRPRDQWPECSDCSRRFEFLVGATCFTCQELRSQDEQDSLPPTSTHTRAGPLLPLSIKGVSSERFADVHHAMTHPVDARQYGRPGGVSTYMNPYHDPITSDQVDENDVSQRFLFLVFTLLTAFSAPR